MKILSIALALIGAVAGIVAATYWYKASAVKIVPKADGRFGGGMALSTTPWVTGALDAFSETARLNKTAALWTAASVLLSAVSAVAGAFSNSN
jgi:hypothetical protein